MSTVKPPIPRMIALDMDGTLIHAGGISRANCAAISAARSAGAAVVIATGRRHSYAMQVLRIADFAPEDIVLSSNGAVARTVRGELLFRRTMPLPTAQRLCRELGEFRNAFVLTFDLFGNDGEDLPGSLVLEEWDSLHGSIHGWIEANRRYIRRVQPIENSLPELSAAEATLPIQAMLCGPMDRMLRAEAVLKAAHDEHLSFFRTEYPARDLCIVDILPHGCSKGSGLERLLTERGLTADDLMCVGDNWNDLPMLELARWPVLMGNAPEPLRTLAKERGWPVTLPCADDGVAAALRVHFSAADAPTQSRKATMVP